MDPQTDSHTPTQDFYADTAANCFNKARQNGEPVFVLRAQDNSAAETVEFWADMNALKLGAQHPKVLEAKDIAQQMRDWPRQRTAD